jgi:Mlc titration factor MtfA (ptsG expression regulator)
MILNWFKQRRRAKILAIPFPDDWNIFIRDNVVHDRHLTVEQQQRLRRMVRIFVAEKNWEGCGGLSLTDEIKVTIAAQACLLVVGMHDDLYFDHVLSILVYPTGYVAQGTQMSRSGLVLESGQPRLGEAWWRGPVILSWADAQAGGRQETPGHNLVLHEFAHQLDMMNGRITDGTPPLKSKNQYDRWVSVLGPEFDNLVEKCSHGGRGLIDCYGATNPAEFFAVITETFFERPVALRQHHGEIYSVLRDYYVLDPAGWSDDTLGSDAKRK